MTERQCSGLVYFGENSPNAYVAVGCRTELPDESPVSQCNATYSLCRNRQRGKYLRLLPQFESVPKIAALFGS
ncbi:hypothetical protein J6590_007832 [Homalodisca vitripennis]|nr:hypothetical protein J6590_007832 [Homalodisca vitripennis]